MAQREREGRSASGSKLPESGHGRDWTRFGTFVAVVAVAAISVANWRLSIQTRDSVDTRLAQIDTRLGQLGKKVDDAAAAASKPARQGPDPSHVYTFKTEGAPVRGSANAPVTIVEVSDFQ